MLVSSVIAVFMLEFIQPCSGQFGFPLAPQANSLDGEAEGTSVGAAGATALNRVATAPITITEEMWSRFIGLSSVFVRRSISRSYSSESNKSGAILVSTSARFQLDVLGNARPK